MVSKENKSKIWWFSPHIQGVPWDFKLPSSTLSFKVVLNKEFVNVKYVTRCLVVYSFIKMIDINIYTAYFLVLCKHKYTIVSN